MDTNTFSFWLNKSENSIKKLGIDEETMYDSIMGVVMCSSLIGKFSKNRYLLLREVFGFEEDYLNFGFVVGRYGNFRGEYDRDTLLKYLKPFKSSQEVLNNLREVMVCVVSADGSVPDSVLDEIADVMLSVSFGI